MNSTAVDAAQWTDYVRKQLLSNQARVRNGERRDDWTRRFGYSAKFRANDKHITSDKKKKEDISCDSVRK